MKPITFGRTVTTGILHIRGDMTKTLIAYQGELHCIATHEPSGAQIETDAPVDNQGQGELFSPTDLIAASLGTCIATVIGILAQRKGWDLRGMRLEVTKEMAKEPPRRIATLAVTVWMPIALGNDDRARVERAAHTCPVHNSLSPEVTAPIVIYWPEETSS
jgi:putative redox protein